MTWLLVLVAGFVFLGTRKRPPRISVYHDLPFAILRYEPEPMRWPG